MSLHPSHCSTGIRINLPSSGGLTTILLLPIIRRSNQSTKSHANPRSARELAKQRKCPHQIIAIQMTNTTLVLTPWSRTSWRMRAQQYQLEVRPMLPLLVLKCDHSDTCYRGQRHATRLPFLLHLGVTRDAPSPQRRGNV